LECAVLEAPNRDREFAEMLQVRLGDIRRDLEDAQEQASDRLKKLRRAKGRDVLEEDHASQERQGGAP
jgi:hypothetical protein